jgi:hypothetical protein
MYRPPAMRSSTTASRSRPALRADRRPSTYAESTLIRQRGDPSWTTAPCWAGRRVGAHSGLRHPDETSS